MRNHKKHKLKSKINKVFRETNKIIEKDKLWRGRFVLLNRAMWLHEYPDHGGVYAIIKVAAFDKRTGKYHEQIMDWYDILGYSGRGGFKLWNFMNDFIVDKVKVWNETPSPNDPDFVKDYTKVPRPQF